MTPDFKKMASHCVNCVDSPDFEGHNPCDTCGDNPMMTKADEERAREIEDSLRKARRILPESLCVSDAVARSVWASIAAALSQARAEAYADAARVARHLNGWGTAYASELAEHIAKAIEAKAKEISPP